MSSPLLRLVASNAEPIAPSVDRKGGGGDDGGMDEGRIAELERIAEKTGDRLNGIEQDIAVIKANYATKEDLYKVINEQTWKLIVWTTGIGAFLIAAAFFIARNVH